MYKLELEGASQVEGAILLLCSLLTNVLVSASARLT